MSEKPTDTAPAPQPAPAPAPPSAPQLSIEKAPPTSWRARKRPAEVALKDHDPFRNDRVHFDARFAAAKSLGRWEDDWPFLTEAEFDEAIEDAGNIQLGGHHPDGSFPQE